MDASNNQSANNNTTGAGAAGSAGSAGAADNVDDSMDEGDEVEVTRDELITSLQEVVQNLSEGLRGTDRDVFLSADDLAQNEWFFAGVSDEGGQYAVTMWPAEGDEDMLRIDIGSEDEVHNLASNPEMLAAMTDDFIEAMDEYEEDYEEYDEDDLDEDDEDVDELEDLPDADYEDASEDDTVRRDGNLPPH